MELLSNICAFLSGLCALVAPIALIVWIVMIIKKSERKKKAKRFFWGTFVGVVLFTAIGVSTSPSIRCEHEWETIEKTNPTCTESGTSVTYCAICDIERDAEEVLPTGHAWVETRKEPTCTEQGEVVKVCSACGTKTSELLVKQHKYTENVIQEATCSNTGLVEKTCSICNKVESVTTEKTSHAYEVTSTKEATLESPGVEESTCTVCGEVKQKESAMLGAKENPGKVTVEQFVSDIKSNKDAAAAKYNEKWIEITGKVLEARNVAGMTSFYLHTEKDGSGLRVVCWVNDEVLKPFDYIGETHTFLGQVREIATANATEIGDCTIISE